MDNNHFFLNKQIPITAYFFIMDLWSPGMGFLSIKPPYLKLSEDKDLHSRWHEKIVISHQFHVTIVCQQKVEKYTIFFTQMTWKVFI
jgi:hypothetical protein